MTVGGPGGPGEASVVFQDPQNRDQLLALHRANTPFLEMAQQMNVAIAADYAKLIQGLSASDVTIIRAAMVQALERDTGEDMPYACQLDHIPPSLVVTESGTADHLAATIAPGK